MGARAAYIYVRGGTQTKESQELARTERLCVTTPTSWLKDAWSQDVLWAQGPLTFTSEENSTTRQQTSKSPSKRLTTKAFWGRTLAAAATTLTSSSIAAPVLTFAEK